MHFSGLLCLLTFFCFFFSLIRNCFCCCYCYFCCCYCCCCCAIVKRTHCPLIIYFCGYSPKLCPIFVAAVVVVIVFVAVVSATNQSNVVPASRNGWSFVFHFSYPSLSLSLPVFSFLFFFAVLVSLCCFLCFLFSIWFYVITWFAFIRLLFCFAARSLISINVFSVFCFLFFVCASWLIMSRLSDFPIR